MPWNYRVVEIEDEDKGTHYEIRSAYYNEGQEEGRLMIGKPSFIGHAPPIPYGTTPEELLSDLMKMVTACQRKILKEKDFKE